MEWEAWVDFLTKSITPSVPHFHISSRTRFWPLDDELGYQRHGQCHVRCTRVRSSDHVVRTFSPRITPPNHSTHITSHSPLHLTLHLLQDCMDRAAPGDEARRCWIPATRREAAGSRNRAAPCAAGPGRVGRLEDEHRRPSALIRCSIMDEAV